MDKNTLQKLLPEVRRIAAEAGDEIQKIAAGRVNVEDKADGSPLTAADMASHRTITEGLEALSPQWPIISEEGDLDNIDPNRFKTYWCVDPLDGTKEFVKKLPEYTVNIALVENGRPVLGVILIPASGICYWAADGLGASKAEGNGEPQKIKSAERKTKLRAMVSRSHLSDTTQEFLEKLNIENTLPRGSSLKICAVADGEADIYPRHGPTWFWDTAAGAAIARQANCRIVDLSGRPLEYTPRDILKHSGFIVCAGDHILKLVKSLID